MQYKANNTQDALQRLPFAPTGNVAIPMQVIHHYSKIARMGFPDGIRCNWCGEEITFGYREKDVQKRRKAFFDRHDQDALPGREP